MFEIFIISVFTFEYGKITITDPEGVTGTDSTSSF